MFNVIVLLMLSGVQAGVAPAVQPVELSVKGEGSRGTLVFTTEAVDVPGGRFQKGPDVALPGPETDSDRVAEEDRAGHIRRPEPLALGRRSHRNLRGDQRRGHR